MMPNASRQAFASLMGLSLRTFVVEDDGEARPDRGNRDMGGGGCPCPGLENDLMMSNLEEELCS
jgi:hypothetical protein